MKLMAMAVVMVTGTSVWAKAVPAVPGADVTVCVDQSTNSSIVYQAQGEASKVFQQVPVRIAWSSGRACKQLDAIHLRMRDETPETLKPGALAYALPYEGIHIELFYDRICGMAPASVLPHLLAHVLVHEITHIIEGVARHSESGVMKAHWTASDFREMSVHPLPFAAEDVQLILNGLKLRGERLQASAGASVTAESR